MRTPIPYYGGKTSMVPELIKLIPKHIQYVEPFIGGGSLFWHKNKSINEVINDSDGRITNFYYIVKTKFHELQNMIHATAHSEINYNESKIILKHGTTDPVRFAWATWVNLNLSFGYKMFAGFRFSNEGQGNITANKRDMFTEAYMERLREVEIFQRDAVELIKLKDSPNTFFYCDPPYVSSNKGHYKNYTMENFVELLETLAQIKGKFLLSSYGEEVLLQARELHGWNLKDIEQVLQVTGKREETKYKTECLTWNYEITKTQLSIFDLSETTQL